MDDRLCREHWCRPATRAGGGREPRDGSAHRGRVIRRGSRRRSGWPALSASRTRRSQPANPQANWASSSCSRPGSSPTGSGLGLASSCWWVWTTVSDSARGLRPARSARLGSAAPTLSPGPSPSQRGSSLEVNPAAMRAAGSIHTSSQSGGPTTSSRSARKSPKENGGAGHQAWKLPPVPRWLNSTTNLARSRASMTCNGLRAGPGARIRPPRATRSTHHVNRPV